MKNKVAILFFCIIISACKERLESDPGVNITKFKGCRVERIEIESKTSIVDSLGTFDIESLSKSFFKYDEFGRFLSQKIYSNIASDTLAPEMEISVTYDDKGRPATGKIENFIQKAITDMNYFYSNVGLMNKFTLQYIELISNSKIFIDANIFYYEGGRVSKIVFTSRKDSSDYNLDATSVFSYDEKGNRVVDTNFVYYNSGSSYTFVYKNIYDNTKNYFSGLAKVPYNGGLGFSTEFLSENNLVSTEIIYSEGNKNPSSNNTLNVKELNMIKSDFSYTLNERNLIDMKKTITVLTIAGYNTFFSQTDRFFYECIE